VRRRLLLLLFLLFFLSGGRSFLGKRRQSEADEKERELPEELHGYLHDFG
jgi:hypothetical protein